LLNIPEFRIGRHDHPRDHVHTDPIEEVTSDYSINRVERGNFAVEMGKRRWELGPGDLFLTYPGMLYRCRHRELMPADVCLTIACLPDSPSREILEFERAVRLQPVVSQSNRLAYLFLEVSRKSGEPMATEEAVQSIFSEITCLSVPRRKLYRERQLSWYAERVDSVRERLRRHYSAEQRLAWLARSVGMSPFHFARVFRELVGLPPHAYLRRIRLQQAARSLREGQSVTEACFTSGFQNLSHFSRQFFRHFGVKPSSYRARRAQQLSSNSE